MSDSAPAAAGPTFRSRRWLLGAAAGAAGAAVACGGAALALRRSPLLPATASNGPLQGKLLVYVRPPGQRAETVPIEQPGALPVRSRGMMSLQVQLNQPAYIYLVWLNAAGQTVPLYPWNTKELESINIRRPPPLRRPAKLVDSPLLGGGWAFGKPGGSETVLLLARRTPMPSGTNLGDLLGNLSPPAPSGDPRQWIILALDGGADRVTLLSAGGDAGQETASADADQTLRDALIRLGRHFELIRAMRFTHAEE